MKKTLTFDKGKKPSLKKRLQIASTSKTAKRVRIGEALSIIVTVKDLAYIVNRSRPTILRYEKEGVFPSSPLRIGNNRYYRLEFCEKLCHVVDTFSPLTKIPADTITKINKLFRDEREFLTSNTIKLCR